MQRKHMPGVAAASILTLALSGVVTAAQYQEGEMSPRGGAGEGQAQSSTGGKGALWRTGQLEKAAVRNREGDKLGKVDQFVIGEDGELEYVIIGYGGFFGMGDKLTAVPWSAVEMAADGLALVIDIDTERFAEAPNFSKDDWPDMADSTWATQVSSYYHAPYSQKAAVDPEGGQAAVPVQEGYRFSELDADGDNQISLDEAAAAPELEAAFQQMDRDASGALDQSEFSAFEGALPSSAEGNDATPLSPDRPQGQEDVSGQE